MAVNPTMSAKSMLSCTKIIWWDTANRVGNEKETKQNKKKIDEKMKWTDGFSNICIERVIIDCLPHILVSAKLCTQQIGQLVSKQKGKQNKTDLKVTKMVMQHTSCRSYEIGLPPQRQDPVESQLLHVLAVLITKDVPGTKKEFIIGKTKTWIFSNILSGQETLFPKNKNSISILKTETITSIDLTNIKHQM